MPFNSIKPKSNQSVTYLSHMGDDLFVVNHARVSFDKKSETLEQRDCDLIEYLATGLRRKERRALIDGMIGFGISYSNGDITANEAAKFASAMIDNIQGIQKHWSPFSHCMASFQLVTPIFVARQIQRSGIGFAPPLADDFGFSEESRRYVSDEPEFFQPAEWRGTGEDIKQGSGGAMEDQTYLNTIHDFEIEEAEKAYKHKLAVGMAPEQARMVLPQSTMTKYNWTGSLMAWSNLCRQRLDPHAQAESQEIAQMISEHMVKLFPVSWKALVRV